MCEEPDAIKGLHAVRDRLIARQAILNRAIAYLDQRIAALEDPEVILLLREAAGQSLRFPEPGAQPVVEEQPSAGHEPKMHPPGRAGKKPYGIAPVASRVLRAVFSPNTRPLPTTLEEALRDVYGEEWGSCKVVQQTAGPGKIVSTTLREDLWLGEKSILRRDLKRGVERLWQFHCGTVPQDHRPSSTLVSIHRVIDMDKRWETIVSTLTRWGIRLALN